MNKISFPFGLLILFCTAAFAEDNLKDDFSGKPWGTWKANGMIASGCLDKTTGRTAPGSLKITLGPDCPLNGSICFIRRLPITPGKSYTVFSFFKSKFSFFFSFGLLNCLLFFFFSFGFLNCFFTLSSLFCFS